MFECYMVGSVILLYLCSVMILRRWQDQIPKLVLNSKISPAAWVVRKSKEDQQPAMQQAVCLCLCARPTPAVCLFLLVALQSHCLTTGSNRDCLAFVAGPCGAGALRPLSASPLRVAPCAVGVMRRNRGMCLQPNLGARICGVGVRALVDSGRETKDEVPDFMQPNVADTIYAQSTAVGMVLKRAANLCCVVPGCPLHCQHIRRCVSLC